MMAAYSGIVNQTDDTALIDRLLQKFGKPTSVV